MTIRRRRPRLLLVAPSAYPLGGVATWIDGLVPGLESSGWEVVVALLAGDFHDVDRYLEAHPQLPAVRRVANPGGSRAGRLRALGAAITEVAPDVVLSVNVGDVEAAIERLRRRDATNARLAVSHHGLLPAFLDHLRAWRATVDHALCTNRLTAALAARYSLLEPNRIGYAPYGVRPPELRPERPDRAGELRILWAGRIEAEQKRAPDLVAIVAELERGSVGFRLRVAGAGPEEERLRRSLAGREPSVEFVGAVGAERMTGEVYPQSDLLLITSAWETGPIVAWEALASGVAVVSSRFLGSGREGALVDGETALLFPVGEASAAAAALARMAEAGLRQRLVAAGRERVLTRYTLEASVAAWDRELRRTVERAPRVASTESASRERSGRPAGRLDRWLGAEAGELARTMLRRRNRQTGPGGEWPHAYGRRDDPEFWRLAESLDARARPAEVAEASS